MSSGRFWMWFWLAVLGVVAVQSAVIAIWFIDSVVAVNLMSIEALILSTGAGIQATLAMRKADDKDPM